MKSSISLNLRPALRNPFLPGPEQPIELADLRAYAFTYTFRGIVVILAALSNYALEHSGFAAPWLPWMVLMPSAAIVLTIRGRRQRRQGRISTSSATAKLMGLLQKSFVLLLLVAVAGACVVGWAVVHPLLLILYGVSTVVAGRVLRFRPLLMGGVACGLLGAIAAAVPADTQLLLIAVAMLVSYVVPGYLLHQHSRSLPNAGC